MWPVSLFFLKECIYIHTHRGMKLMDIDSDWVRIGEIETGANDTIIKKWINRYELVLVDRQI